MTFLACSLNSGVLCRLAATAPAQLEVVGRDAVLEEHRVEGVPERLEQVEGDPLLVLVDAHDAVAEVVVLADDVGEVVVELVVRDLPLLGRRGVVPLPGRRVDLRVAHPVPLAVEDVVADLHVVEDLGHRQAGGADDPGRREDREQQHGAAAQLDAALGLDDLADVLRVARAAAVDHALPDRVELDAEHLDVLGREVRDRVVGLLLDRGHRISFKRWRVGVSGRGGSRLRRRGYRSGS